MNQHLPDPVELSDARSVSERDAFEEAVFAEYFLSTIKRNPNVPTPRISGALDFVSAGCKTKAEFVERGKDGHYRTDTLNAAWWAWQKRAEAHRASANREADDELPITADWLQSIGFLPDGDDPARAGLAIKIWELGQTEDNGEEPAMHFLWQSDDGSCWLEAYGTGGETLCLIELEPKKTRGEIRRFCEALGIKLSANLCPTCSGTGQVVEFHESYAPETLGCPHCMGSGKRGGQ